MKYLLVTALMFSSFISFSEASSNKNNHKDLKILTIEKFLKEANNSKSKLGLSISQINTETTDGRNPNGAIELPVTKSDLQIVRLSNEILMNPWHYASLNSKGDVCTASGDSSTFLILLTGKTGVHMAQESESYNFTVSTSEELKAKRKDGGKIEFCGDVANDESNVYVESSVKTKIGEIDQVEIVGKEQK